MKITYEHKKAMEEVANGADVYDYYTAKLLREVEKGKPALIEITKPMMYKGDGTDRMPYFGAILTNKGRETIGLGEANQHRLNCTASRG